jgi:hypothetical protein
MPWARVWVLALLMGGVGVAPADAAGLEAGAPSAAQARYKIGRDLYRKGRFAEAAAEFKVALGLFPSAVLAYNLARSAERAALLDDAILAYERYLELSVGADDAETVRALVAVLKDQRDASLPRVAITTRPAGAAVTVNGSTMAAVSTPATLRLRPGAHILRLSLEGYQTVDRTVEVQPGQGAALEVVLTARAAPKVEAKPVLSPLGWAGVAAAAVGVGLAGYAVSEAFAVEDEADALNDRSARGDVGGPLQRRSGRRRGPSDAGADPRRRRRGAHPGGCGRGDRAAPAGIRRSGRRAGSGRAGRPSDPRELLRWGASTG